MATRIYAVNPGESEFNVRENVGPTGTSAIVAVVVDLTANVVGPGGVSITIAKSDVLKALEQVENWVLKQNWPPA